MTLLILILIAVGAGAWVAAPLLREGRPGTLAEPSGTAEAIHQEEQASVEALRDLAMDFKLGNLSEADYRVLAIPLQQRAKRAQALRAERIEQESVQVSSSPELDQILEQEILATRRAASGAINGSQATGTARYCHDCGAAAQPADRFCASCGTALRPAANKPANADPVHNTSAAGAMAHPAIPAQAAVAASTAQTAAAPARTSAGNGHDATATVFQRGRWLWWGAAAVVVLWVAAVAGIYLSGRDSQLAQTPVARFDSPVQGLVATNDGMLLGTTTGIQTSGDGRTWTAAGLEEPILTAAPADAAGMAWLAATPTGLWRSQDGGVIWQRVETELGFVELAAVPQSGVVWGVTAEGLYASEDGGETWTPLSSSLPGRAQALAVGPGLLFLGTDRGVFSSSDGGQTWTNRNGVVNGRIASLDIRSLAYDGINKMLYAGTPVGLSFLNLESFGGWGRRALEGDVTALALVGDNNQVLWVGTADGRLFRSPDRGVTWR